MRRVLTGVIAILLVGILGFGGDLGNWSSDGTFSYSSSIVVQNVSDTAALVQITYQTPCDPTTPDYQATVAPGTSQTVNVNDAFPGPWESTAIVTSDAPIVATQNIIWADPSGGTQWAAHSGAKPGASDTWYLAEGSTYAGFQSYVSIQNPNAQAAQVEVTYMTPGGTHVGPTVSIDPIAQTEIDIADTLPDWSSISAVVTSDVPVVAQLSTTWNGSASTTTSMGVTMPGETWYLAEGSTTGGFETWLMVQNPSTETAHVSVSYIADGKQSSVSTLNVAPMTHDTFSAADTLPDQPHFATIITSDVSIVAVQSKTWEGHSGYGGTVGVPSSATEWFFPVARTHPGASTWIAVQNVGDTSAEVSVTYATHTGAVDGPDLALDPFARQSISLPESVSDQVNFSVVVTSDQPIVAIHGSYWETGSGVRQHLAFGVTQPSTTWFVPITPHAPSQMSQEPGSSPPSPIADRDGDGVPDDEDYCPDFPGRVDDNGC